MLPVEDAKKRDAHTNIKKMRAQTRRVLLFSGEHSGDKKASPVSITGWRYWNQTRETIEIILVLYGAEMSGR